uniref:Uncharacterized protein n=1 Tax=Arundo donax TaxID=35708 RepID=A0A0A9BCD9_ARUDO
MEAQFVVFTSPIVPFVPLFTLVA